jgi:macrolide transport system ATP-binding/permease protein
MMNVLHELHARGHTIILVTHDMQVANHAERIIEISDGEIIRDQLNPNATVIEKRVIPEKETLEKPSNFIQANYGRFAEAFKMAVIALSSHRMRTLLTMLGIIIGITSVVSVVALGQGARQKIIYDISSMGTNVIDINPGKDWGDEDAASIQTLVPADLEALKSQVYVDSATPATGGS